MMTVLNKAVDFIKKNLSYTLIIFTLILLITYLQNTLGLNIIELGRWLSEKETGAIIVSHIKIFFLLIWLMGIIYSRELLRKSALYRWFFILLLPLGLYCWNVKLRIFPVYELAKERGDKVGKVYINDEVLGYKHAPLSTGYRLLGETDITIQHDADGHRIPFGYKHPNAPLGALTLGCSVSYGDACWAENSFAHLLSKKTNTDYINASVSGNGLSQMVLNAERIIPEKHPKYAIVQYSSWLANRSTTYYQSFLGGKFPIPYFSDKGLEEPVFSPKGLWKPLGDFKNTPRSSWDFFKFYLRLSPSYFYQDFNALWVSVKAGLGFVNKPSTDREKTEAYGYDRIYQACKKNNTKMIVWTTGTGFSVPTKLPPASVLNNPDIIKVYIDSLQLRIHPEADNADTYKKVFAHWYLPKGKKDSVFVDGHPNNYLHSIIADEIYRNIVEYEKKERKDVISQK
jgi:hypothetical protein